MKEMRRYVVVGYGTIALAQLAMACAMATLFPLLIISLIFWMRTAANQFERDPDSEIIRRCLI